MKPRWNKRGEEMSFVVKLIRSLLILFAAAALAYLLISGKASQFLNNLLDFITSN